MKYVEHKVFSKLKKVCLERYEVLYNYVETYSGRGGEKHGP